jgi:homospermidine synthase
VNDFEERLGIVRHGRWLAWGFNHGVAVRPHWFADAIVTGWNWLSCHLFGHEWMPQMLWQGSDVTLSETDEFCPNCCAERSVA